MNAPPNVAPLAEEMLTRELRTAAARWRAQHHGFAYHGPAGFVLEHGEWFRPDVYPLNRYPQGGAQLCYANALCLACSGENLVYVEGYAVMAGGEVAQHAWNADPDGRLIDSTWLNTGHAYLGVRFSVERADDCTWNGDATVLDDYRRRWPLLRSRWEGEPDGVTEPLDDAARTRLGAMHVAGVVGVTRARLPREPGTPVHVSQMIS